MSEKLKWDLLAWVVGGPLMILGVLLIGLYVFVLMLVSRLG